MQGYWVQYYKTFLSVIYKQSYKAGEIGRIGTKSLPGTNTSLLQKPVNYGQKGLITLGPGLF